ncbi:MAG: hypothetical protein ACLPWF_29820 [Bryobacteraceae bacterium]
MSNYLALGLVCGLFAGAAFAADDVASAVVATVKTVDKGTKTVVVKTADGTEHTFHFIGRTVAHGAEATAKGSKDAFEGMKEGDEVVVHYTVKGTEKTAQEVDHIGKDGLKASEVVVKSVDHGAKTVTVKTAEGAEETYHISDRAVKESGKGLEKAGKVTIYYTDDAGKKVVHFFKQS